MAAPLSHEKSGHRNHEEDFGTSGSTNADKMLDASDPTQWTPGQWGRKTASSMGSRIVTTLAVLGCPIWVTINWIALEHCEGSLITAIQRVLLHLYARQGDALLALLPKTSWSASGMFIGWLLFQAALFHYMPGRMSYGQRTPGGHILKYVTNGLMAWTVTHLCFGYGVHQGIFDMHVIADHWEGLFVAANVYGYVLAAFAYAKAYYMPSFSEDRKFSGSWVHDFWMGIELNPRLGKYFDLKLFHNGRPGIVAWTLIDISFAAYQYRIHGYVSNSMFIVLALQSIYVLDFFTNEDWYLRTIDIAHDHFGMMLSWGDSVFLPSFYTLQAQYLARYPVNLTPVQAAALFVLGLAGYMAFRSANEQKDHVRQTNGNTTIWNAPAEFLRCTYRTSDGKEHTSLLLTSGWWGLCRHANYTADLVLSFAACAACAGNGHLLPWSYVLYLTVLLVHRTWRDEGRCAQKYGDKWEEYCQIVPWRLIPGVY